MSDEYEPAIESANTDAGAESAPIERAADVVSEPADDTPAVGGPRGQREVSDKVREMLRGIASKGLEIGDDLQPMEHESPPAAAAPAAVEAPPPASVEAPAAPAAAAVAPEPKIDIGKAAAEQAKLLFEAEKKAFEAEKAQLAEREKRLPSSADLIERPGATLATWLKDVYGASDTEIKDIIEDVVTELSEHALGIQLPSELKGKLESRKAVRSVKAYKADLTRQQQQIAEERKAAERTAREEAEKVDQARREAAAHQQIATALAASKNEFKFLHAQVETQPADIVLAVVKEQIARGEDPNIKKAAEFADAYFRKQAESIIKESKRLQSLLTPATPAPAAPTPAQAAKPPGGAPAPAPVAQPKPAPVDDEPLANVDWRDQRRAKARQLARQLPRG